MNLCSSGHEEICFEERECPFCASIAKKDETIKDLEEEREALESAIVEANARIAELQEEPLITQAENALRAVAKANHGPLLLSTSV